jgi:hypothetical protein
VIVRESDGQLILVRQADHDDQCGRMAACLDPALFPGAEPGMAAQHGLRLAAFLHDNGWAAWEERPRLQPETGRPMLFTHLAEADWCDLYRDGITVAVEADPLAGLLVSMHGLGLRRGFLGISGATNWREPRPGEDPEVERFCQEQELLQTELIERLRAIPNMAAVVAGAAAPSPDASGAPQPLDYGATLLRLYKLLEFLDNLSLHLCWRSLSEEPLGPLPAADPAQPDRMVAARKVDAHTLALVPYPCMRSPLLVPVAARVLEDRAYADDADYRLAFLAVEVVALPFVLVAG